MTTQEGAGEVISRAYLTPAVSSEQMLSNMRAAIARGLPQATPCKAHSMLLSVAGGGPSLSDTYKDLTGFTCAVNGSLKFLLERGVTPNACAVMDAGAHIADMLVAHPDVRYYVASICDPSVFDKLQGCDVRLWHVTPETTADPVGLKALLDDAYQGQWHAIGGGCTMGLRWINLGYFLGFRRFHVHGLDSSFSNGNTHAYPDRADDKEHIMFDGYATRMNFLAQVHDFADMLEWLHAFDSNVQMEVFGEGLLQNEWKAFRQENPEAFAGHNAGHMSRAEAAAARARAILKRVPEGPVCGAEVGVFAGALSSRLLRRRDLDLLMVDSWEGDGAAYTDKADWHATLSQAQQERFYQMAVDATAFASARRHIMRQRSAAAAHATPLGSLDFVFLDADHSYAGCAADIDLWRPCVKPGGWLCGHDYNHASFPGVKQAVDERLGPSIETDADGTWFFQC